MKNLRIIVAVLLAGTLLMTAACSPADQAEPASRAADLVFQVRVICKSLLDFLDGAHGHLTGSRFKDLRPKGFAFGDRHSAPMAGRDVREGGRYFKVRDPPSPPRLVEKYVTFKCNFRP